MPTVKSIKKHEHRSQNMKSILRRTVSSVLISVMMLGVVGAGLAGAQSHAGTAAYAGSNWHYNLSFGKATSLWDAQLKQSASGQLTGTVDPPTGDCLAKVTSGQVAGNSLRMTWQISSPCRPETVKVKGTIYSGRISGTVVDSLHGAGTFVATRDW
jgi:hypothetical protein